MDIKAKYQSDAWKAGMLTGLSMVLVGYVYLSGERGYVLIAALAVMTVTMMRFAVKYYNSHDDEKMEQMQAEYNEMHEN